MEYRILGNTDLKPSVIGVGCNQMGDVASMTEYRESEAMLKEALERGVNLFDTADIYGGGASERILGKVFQGQRHRVILCSKAGMKINVANRTARWFAPRAARRFLRRWKSIHAKDKTASKALSGRNFKPSYIAASIEKSLSRLGTDYLDLFLLHGPAREVSVNCDLFEALNRVKERGLIRYYGVSVSSSSSSEDAVAFLQAPGVSVIQLQRNPIKTVDIGIIVPLAVQRDVGVILREPLYKGEILGHPSLAELAAKNKYYSLPQMTIRAALQTEGVSSVLVGMRTRNHLRENIGALSGPPLIPGEVDELYASAQVS
jgi:aryl-alcohol dehydrogenase-like predicted oxidoreductase